MEVSGITQLIKGKTFQIEIKTNKNNTYLISFASNEFLEIEANQINDIIKKSFSNKFTFQEIRVNRYFLQFNSLNEIFDELIERMNNSKILIEENENNFKIKIPLLSSKNKEIIFVLNEKNDIDNDNEKLDNLNQLINEQNKEITNLKNENVLLKNEINNIKEKLNILWIEQKGIFNLNSKIINGNIDYNIRIKNWINPSKKIKAELLYRLSENGDQFKIFHRLCDNKGPTLTLFHVNDGNKVGIYTPLCWDSTPNWKNDMETFIFNLNKNQKYKKLKSNYSAYCNSSYGPYTLYFGCPFGSMKSISHYGKSINEYYDKGSEILSNNDERKDYDLLEAEVYKIIIE